MKVQHFYHEPTGTLTYVLYKEGGSEAVVIDPVWDFDPISGNLTQEAYTQLKEFLNSHSLKPVACLETHIHADHITASQLLKSDYPGLRVVMGEKVEQVRKTFSQLLGLEAELKNAKYSFDTLVKDGGRLTLAGFEIKAIATPGHTPACVSYLVEGCLFTGDSLFMPDFGSGRCDFPGGSAQELYHSIHDKIYGLPDDTKVFVGHDYMPGGRELRFQTSVGESKELNKHLKVSTSQEEFVSFRESRDAQLKLPKLIYQSLQLNLRVGHLPEPEPENSQRFIKLPVKAAS